ncbi:unnamed protein product [Paramecium sonneborni]|uniref:Uncharacterized protein n=1 Tax=Paramecium sonneborni TaxID=65129 RepID=A0A8S1QSZ2_9CILI|nr:unnamed protein product [Paramecium sonneborni]
MQDQLFPQINIWISKYCNLECENYYKDQLLLRIAQGIYQTIYFKLIHTPKLLKLKNSHLKNRFKVTIPSLKKLNYKGRKSYTTLMKETTISL